MKKLVLLVITICFVFSGAFNVNAVNTEKVPFETDKAVKNISETMKDNNGFVVDEKVKVNAKNGKNKIVNIDKSLLGKITNKDVIDLAMDYINQDDIQQINIDSIVNADETNNPGILYKSSKNLRLSPQNNSSEIQPQAWYDFYDDYGYTDYYYNKTGSSRTQYTKADKFVISCAKGQTVQLSSTWSYTIAASVSGTTGCFTAGLSASITAQYSTSITFSGPPESSSCNTREFRCKFIEYRGTCNEWWFWWPSGDISSQSESGTFKEPLKTVSYSLDKTVK